MSTDKEFYRVTFFARFRRLGHYRAIMRRLRAIPQYNGFPEWLDIDYWQRASPEEIENHLRNGADIDYRDNRGCTALHFAASHGSPIAIQKLLEAGAQIECEKRSAVTPLHYAIADSAPIANVEALLEHGADPDSRDILAFSVLHTAVSLATPQHLLLLLRAGANIEVYDGNGNTPLHCSAKRDKPEAMQLLVDYGADTAARTSDHAGETALHIAARNDSWQCVELLLDTGVDIESLDKSGNTALHSAASGLPRTLSGSGKPYEPAKGAPNSIQTLIEADAYLEARNKFGRTPLHLAAASECAESVQALYRAGANLEARFSCRLNIEDDLRKASIEVPSSYDQLDLWTHTALHTAAQRGITDNVTFLLDAGADISIETLNRRTVLHFAAHNRRYGASSIEKLLSAGADLEAMDLSRQTALHTAAIDRIPRNIFTLLKSGADVNAVDRSGRTALHMACERNLREGAFPKLSVWAEWEELKHGNDSIANEIAPKMAIDPFNGVYYTDNIRAICKLLLDHGANIEARAEHGWAALHFAAAYGAPENISTLLDFGARIEARTKKGWSSLPKEVSPVSEFHPDHEQALVNSLKRADHQINWPNRGSLLELTVKPKIRRGWTALHIAVSVGTPENVEALITAGADTAAQGHGGINIRHLAKINPNLDPDQSSVNRRYIMSRILEHLR